MNTLDSLGIPDNFTPQNLKAQVLDSDKSRLERSDLLNGESKKIEIPATEGPNLIATIRTISDAQLKDGEPDTFTIIDLRGVQLVGGLREFNGNKFGPDIEYLLVDPSQLDWEDDKGYKGIRRGETIKMGRYVEPTVIEISQMSPEEKKSIVMKRDRFPGLGSWTSRNHFSLSCDEKGNLLVSDLNSSNGTTIAVGEAAISLLSEEQHRKRVDEMVRPVGEILVESELPPPPLTAEAMQIVPYMDRAKSEILKAELLMLSNPEINHHILKNFSELAPAREIELDGKKYYFSAVFDTGKRLHVIAYVEVDGKLMPRLFYKSNSEGGWRSCPGWEKNKRRYSKGPHDNDGGYVQITKPVEELSRKIEIMAADNTGVVSLASNRVSELLDIFDLESDEMDEVTTFEDEVTLMRLDERWAHSLYDSYEPGIGFKYGAEKSRGMLENMELLPGFEPDFTKPPIRKYAITHTIAGLCEVSVYNADYINRSIEWHMARSESGDIWVESIRFTDSEITSYGTPSEVILAGALSAKPYEYIQCVENMVIDEDYEWISGRHGTKYVSLRKTWDRMPPIKRYKKALGLGES